MARSRRFHPLVAEDLAQAVSHYDEVSPDLGNRFRLAVRDRIRMITGRPESFGCIHQDFRAAMLDRFPYVVVFEHENDTVTISQILQPQGFALADGCDPI